MTSEIGPNVGAGPDGNPELAKRLSYPVRTAAAGALIGRVGNSAPFAIGSRGEVVMPADGLLSLGVNDDRFEDNSGWFTVRVIRSTAAPSRPVSATDYVVHKKGRLGSGQAPFSLCDRARK